jgi:hypothetical protein
VNEQIRKIQEYIYARYVDPGAHGALDEEAALRVLEEYYRRPEAAKDSECCYLGFLYFERGYALEDEAARLDYFRRARYWLRKSGDLSHESWDAVDDRLADLDGWFEQQGASPELAGAAPSGAAVALPRQIEDHGGVMVLVPAGPFAFGPEREQRALPAFYIDKYPVTNKQYGAFCRATQYRWPKYWTDARFNNPEQPVVGVSAADAVKYCKWAGKDLPTEEMWEKAARGTDGRAYPWGESPPDASRACFGGDPEKDGPAAVSAHEAGESPCGAMDLAGNVWEWTATAIEDGEAFQVVKGGCFSDPPELLRADLRLEAGPKDKFENIGFRCVRMA